MSVGWGLGGQEQAVCAPCVSLERDAPVLSVPLALQEHQVLPTHARASRVGLAGALLTERGASVPRPRTWMVGDCMCAVGAPPCGRMEHLTPQPCA